MPIKSTTNGQFVRSRTDVWTPKKWNDGYVDNRGRFRVYRPDYPRAYAMGYALRAHVVWWLHHGKVHPRGTNLHHKDENKLNDTLTNLQLIGHAEHTRHHQFESFKVKCERCGKEFWTQKGRIGNGRGKFCSRFCVDNRVRIGPRYKRIAFRNKCLLLSEWSKELKIPYSVLRGRKLLGWSVEKMLTTPKNKKGRTDIVFNGVAKTLYQWADDIGVKPHTLYMRIFKYKWPLEKALTKFSVR